jgi:hypothetical protein
LEGGEIAGRMNDEAEAARSRQLGRGPFSAMQSCSRGDGIDQNRTQHPPFRQTRPSHSKHTRWRRRRLRAGVSIYAKMQSSQVLTRRRTALLMPLGAHPSILHPSTVERFPLALRPRGKHRPCCPIPTSLLSTPRYIQSLAKPASPSCLAAGSFTSLLD